MYITTAYKKEILQYNRNKAISYAHIWALDRNPAYYDFSDLGGDCTNFASQVIYAGSNIMNYKSDVGWYYVNANQRAPAWTDVDFLYNFLVHNMSKGPFGEEVDVKDVKPGDIVQLAFNSEDSYDHAPVIIETGAVPDIDNIRIASHTIDRDNYPLKNYNWEHIRFIHIEGVYK